MGLAWTDEMKISTLADFKEVANFMLGHRCRFSLSEIGGIEYGFMIARDGNGIEVYDTVEDDNCRVEKFPDVDSALSGFIVAGKPIAEYIPGVTLYPVVNH